MPKLIHINLALGVGYTKCDWVTCFAGYDKIEDRRINMPKKYGYIMMKIKVKGYTFVLAFCLLIIFCVHTWKITSLYSRNANGKIETAPS